ncbi:MAG: adenylate kinase family protein [Candidatus Hydrothermarchaeales archaeon]
MKDVILLTGTPGTGKSTVAKVLSSSTGFKLISINDVVEEDYLYLEEDSRVVDLNKLPKKVRRMIRGDCIIEGHLAHLLGIGGMVIVLRTHPKELKKRLEKKGFSKKKLEENLEAEALDVCLIESVERYETVYEIDTTGKEAEYVAGCITRILSGDGEEFSPGKISWLEEYLDSRR